MDWFRWVGTGGWFLWFAGLFGCFAGDSVLLSIYGLGCGGCCVDWLGSLGCCDYWFGFALVCCLK